MPTYATFFMGYSAFLKVFFPQMPSYHTWGQPVSYCVIESKPNWLAAHCSLCFVQKKLIHSAKQVFLLVCGEAYEKYGKSLRGEQEIVGMLSDMVIEIWAMESALLRSLKILNGRGRDRGAIPVKMTKVFFHDGIERIGFLARSALEVLEEEGKSNKYLKTIRRLMVSPPINTVTLRRDIADWMIRQGRYVI